MSYTSFSGPTSACSRPAWSYRSRIPYRVDQLAAVGVIVTERVDFLAGEVVRSTTFRKILAVPVRVLAVNIQADHQRTARGRLRQVYNPDERAPRSSTSCTAKLDCVSEPPTCAWKRMLNPRPRRHRGDRHILTEVEMRARCASSASTFMPAACAEPYDFPNVQNRAVIGQVVDRHRLRERVLSQWRPSHPRQTCKARIPKPVVHLRVDVNRNRAGQHERVDDAAVYVAAG